MNVGIRWSDDQLQDLYMASMKLARDHNPLSGDDISRSTGLAMLRALLPRVPGREVPSTLGELLQDSISIAFRELSTGDIVLFSNSESDEVLLGCVLGHVNRHLIYISPDTNCAEITELDDCLLGRALSDCRRLLAECAPEQKPAISPSEIGSGERGEE